MSLFIFNFKKLEIVLKILVIYILLGVTVEFLFFLSGNPLLIRRSQQFLAVVGIQIPEYSPQ